MARKAHQFTAAENAIMAKGLPRHWYEETGYLAHPIGDILEKDASGGYTLTQLNSFPDLQSALAWLKENGV